MAALLLPAMLFAFDAAAPRLSAQVAAGQSAPGYVMKRWTVAEGLPHNMITALIQTRDGYIWIGTSNAGVVRFDGVSFTTFDVMNTPGFPANGIYSFHEDDAGTLWIGTAFGFAIYRDGEFTYERLEGGPERSLISDLTADRSGHMWAIAGDHVARRDDTRWTTIEIGDVTPLSVAPDRDGAVWIGTLTGLVEWRDGVVKTFTVKDGLPNSIVSSLFQDRLGQVWIGTPSGLARLDREAGKAIAESGPLARAPVSQLFEDSSGVLWIGSTGRLFVRTRDGIVSQSPVGDTSAPGSVSVFTEDRQGHLWFGVYGGRGGLHRLGRTRVTTLTHADGLPCDNSGPVTEGPDGTLWLGTLCGDGRGVTAWRNGRLTHYPGPRSVESILAEADGAVWVGTFDGELFRLENGAFVRYPAPISGHLDAVAVIYRHTDRTLWLATHGGLLSFHQGKWTRFRTSEGLVNDDVRAIVEAPDGSLWIGTAEGISHYNNGRFTNYSVADGLPPGPVRAVHLDSQGVIWLGTYGGGLARFKDGTFTAYGTADGVLDTSVHRIIDDGAGYFWLTGDHGIRRVSRRELDEVADGMPATLSVVLYDEADGMQSAECNGMSQPAGWRMRDGTLRIPTQLGLVSIDPSTADADAPLPPQPRIEHATINGVRHESASMVTASPGSSDFEIEYTAPAFLRPERIQFRYRLEGYDADWVEAGTRRVAHYTNLAPGNYRFRVTARSNGGAWAEEAATVGLVLQPYVYQRLPVQIALVVLGLIAAAGLLRWRITTVRQRARRLETAIDERTAEVQRQRDEVTDARDRVEVAKKEVENARDQVLAVLNQLDIGVLVLSEIGVVRYVSESAQRLLHEDAQLLVGRSWTACLPLVDTDRQQIKSRIEAPSPSGTRVPVQMVIDGRRYWMEIDVRHEPRPGHGRILYIYNVTEVSTLTARGDRHEGPHDLVGRSTAMHVVYKQIRDVARVDATVLIEGETGSGKELVARAIHRGSRRADKPFVAINAAGLTESLLASQLFGHRRGAFTGAVADQVGVFEAANGGTLFLDEIGDIPLSVQVSLLRVLQEREITRVGESRARQLDVRFLAATHRDLSREVADGRFRQDLLYRIRVATIRVPPLRDRLDDLPLLVDAFVAQASRQSGRPIPEVSREAIAMLTRYTWPGNVRQLKSVIEQALLGSAGRVLRVEDLPTEVVDGMPTTATTSNATERERLVDALRLAGGNRSEAARRLGIGRATLYRKLAAHGLDTGEERRPGQ